MMKIVLLILLFLSLQAKELVSPIPLSTNYDIQKAQLGKVLFHEVKMSRDNTTSCASCHMLHEGGDDNRVISFGVENRAGVINSPTVFNTRFNLSQFWNGRAKNLTEQVSGPIHNPLEMDMTFDEIIKKLQAIPKYVKEFEIYDDGITKKNIVESIVEFEKALTTPNARFDKYLLGDKNAITKEELEGFELFKDLGCVSCHNGINIGGNLYQKMGVLKEYKTESEALGRFEVTKKEEDKYFFKVPSLRNIELTAPYFHDGKAEKLEDAIEVMIEHQVGMIPKKEEIRKVKMFLKTLKGELPSIMDER